MSVEFIVFFIMLIVFAIIALVLILTIFTTDNEKPKLVKEKPLPTYPDAYWLENSRGYSNVEIFPPCFDISTPAKKAYSLLLHRNLVTKYKKLFEVMSFVCCQQKELQNKKCNNLAQRINQMQTMGADITNKHATLSAAAYTTLQNNDNSKFIIAAFSLMEEQVDQIQNDPDLPKVDKEAVRGFVHMFYQTHLDTINNISC